MLIRYTKVLTALLCGAAKITLAILDVRSWLEKLNPAVVSKAARRDAAIRIAYLALYVTGGNREQVIREAHVAHPLAMLALAQKAIRRLAPGAIRKLIG